MPNGRPGLFPTVQIATAGRANGKPNLGRGAPKCHQDPRRRPTGRPDLVATIHIATPAQNRPD